MTKADVRGPILVVDDDDAFRQVLSGELARRGYDVHTAASGSDALERAPQLDPAVILLDLRLPDMSGIEVLELLRAREVAAGVIVLTGHGTIDTAIQAIRIGAYDYLEKPCPMDKVEFAIHKALEHGSLVARQRVLQDGLAPPDVRSGFVGNSAVFRRLCDTIGRIAAADAATLVMGETGVGKEMVAALLHAQSPRCDAPFVVVDCAALDEDLLRSELFGHEKGAFTGAHRRKHGLLEVASGGTLFLDEVGEASLETQSKLLRVLETGRFRRIGGNDEITVDLRVVSATNVDLREAVDHGRFRADLLFRLSTLLLEVPPLRERREDVSLLVEHYLGRLTRRYGRDVRFSPAALEALASHEWPGNVRELIHVIEQAVVLATGPEIGPDELPGGLLSRTSASSASSSDAPPVRTTLREVQRLHTLRVLDEVAGNRAEAARILGVSERHLYRLLRKYGPAADGPDLHAS